MDLNVEEMSGELGNELDNSDLKKKKTFAWSCRRHGNSVWVLMRYIDTMPVIGHAKY